MQKVGLEPTRLTAPEPKSDRDVARRREPNDFEGTWGAEPTVRDGGPYSVPIEARHDDALVKVVTELAERVREAAVAGDLALARVLVRGLLGVLAESAPATER